MTRSHLSLIALKHFHIYSEGLSKLVLPSAVWNGLWDTSFAQLSITTYNTASCNSGYLSFLCFIEHVICYFERKSVIVVILPMKNILLKHFISCPLLKYISKNKYVFVSVVNHTINILKTICIEVKFNLYLINNARGFRQEDSLLSYDEQQVIATMWCPLCLPSI